MKIDVAVGEVPWERGLLAAIAGNRDVEMGRRLVDITAAKDVGELLIASPSVRGFSETAMQRWNAAARVIVIRDSIRPPWLDDSNLDVREIDDVLFDDLVSECARHDPTPRLRLVEKSDRAAITAFCGVSGGVGVSTLAWLYAQQQSGRLLIDCNLAQPALGLLVGSDSHSSTLSSAIRELQHTGSVQLRDHVIARNRSAAVLTLPLHQPDSDDVLPSELGRLLVHASEQFPEVVLDLGSLADARTEDVLDHIDRLVVVTTATPLGLVRLCTNAGAWSGLSSAIVVNRLRESATGSRHVATAIRSLVSGELGRTPTLVPDLVADCDRGWLVGEWGAMGREFGVLEFQDPA